MRMMKKFLHFTAILKNTVWRLQAGRIIQDIPDLLAVRMRSADGLQIRKILKASALLTMMISICGNGCRSFWSLQGCAPKMKEVIRTGRGLFPMRMWRGRLQYWTGTTKRWLRSSSEVGCLNHTNELLLALNKKVNQYGQEYFVAPDQFWIFPWLF